MYRKKEEPLVPNMTVHEAAAALGTSDRTVQIGLIQGVFPWGVAIRTDEHRYRYLINKTRFEEHERVVLPKERG